MSLFIDISLVSIFFITLFVCYKRGFFKTIMTALKLLLTLVATYYVQDYLRPIIERFIPLDLTGKVTSVTSNIAGGLIEEYFQVVAGNFISSAIIFLAFYLIFTLLGNILLEILERFILTKLLNRLGGLIIGIVLGSLAVIVASYIIAIFLLIKNSTTGIMIIYNSYFLKTIVANNVQFILENLVH